MKKSVLLHLLGSIFNVLIYGWLLAELTDLVLMVSVNG